MAKRSRIIRRLDFLAAKLVRLGEGEYVTGVLKLHKIPEYEQIPYDVAETVSEIFDERIKEIEEN